MMFFCSIIAHVKPTIEIEIVNSLRARASFWLPFLHVKKEATLPATNNDHSNFQPNDERVLTVVIVRSIHKTGSPETSTSDLVRSHGTDSLWHNHFDADLSIRVELYQFLRIAAKSNELI
jgi:hypothetical protein